MSTPDTQHLVDRRRRFHQYPEPSWCEFLTTVRIVEELEEMGVDEIHVGPDAIDPDGRLGVPDDETLAEWYERARSHTDRMDVLEQLEGGNTGVVAVVSRGEGPTVGLRVDIDALPILEANDDSHNPVAEGFRSENDGTMHACGHDAHMTMGLATLETVVDSDFSGTFKVFFQPAEEVSGGGKPMSETEHVEDLDYFYGVHVGLGHPTGEVVPGYDEQLAITQFELEYTGESAHAGLAPHEGRNAVQALGTAIQILYGIPRHGGGDSRVNVGKLDSKNPANIVAERASAAAEVRGETIEIMEWMWDRANAIIERSADMHECEVDVEVTGRALRVDSDEELVDVGERVAREVDGVTSVVRRAPVGASEDVTYLMKAVKDHGGVVSFVNVGTDHPDGHHTPRFDVDENSLPIGVGVLSGMALELLD
ncbi:MAG: amidohydrolase [Halodesulfurarchaeum sp.]